MAKLIEQLFGKKIHNIRIVPVVLKIVIIFSLFIMVSSLASNYINLMLNRTEQIKLMKQLLVKDLKQIYTFSNNQNEIFQFNQDLESAITNIEEFCVRELVSLKSIVLGVKSDGTLFLQGHRIQREDHLQDSEALEIMNENKRNEIYEDSLTFLFNNDSYFGVYKYNSKWDIFLVRAEELNEFYRESWVIFRNVSILIIVITVASAVVGIFLLSHTLRYVGIITSALMDMQKNQQLNLIDLSKATNDDISYLGVSFNSLSSTVNNLMTIFRKFVTKDVALKAYRDRYLRLEGSQRELTILFSDIKSFTFITETLGTDIIKLLNMHYDRAIGSVQDNDGIVGSIIGDALLAVFGTLPDSRGNKSMQAVKTAYEIQEATSLLRREMREKREEIVKRRGDFTTREENLYKAVLLEVGVGIDGGNVFYGNIGSRQHMTNTVIGDNVNSSSRLEGLTRIYHVPVICSEYIKNEIEENIINSGYRFLELDQVQVKGKTEGKRIYWPIQEENLDTNMQDELEAFSQGLNSYYQGDWKKARAFFKKCTLPLVSVFKERTRENCPKDWNGIWTMMTK